MARNTLNGAAPRWASCAKKLHTDSLRSLWRQSDNRPVTAPPAVVGLALGRQLRCPFVSSSERPLPRVLSARTLRPVDPQGNWQNPIGLRLCYIIVAALFRCHPFEPDILSSCVTRTSYSWAAGGQQAAPPAARCANRISQHRWQLSRGGGRSGKAWAAHVTAFADTGLARLSGHSQPSCFAPPPPQPQQAGHVGAASAASELVVRGHQLIRNLL